MWNAHCGRDLWEVATVSGGLWTSPWELVAKLWDLWQSQAAQAPREMWAATHIHSQIGSSCDPWGPCLPLLALTQVFYLGSCRLQPAHPPLTFTKAGSFVLLVCKRISFNNPLSWSLSTCIGQPLCPSSSRLSSPLQNFLKSHGTIHPLAVPGPNLLMFQVVSAALGPILNSNKFWSAWRRHWKK